MELDASLLNTQHYKVRIKGKLRQSREGVASSPTPWCSSYRKGSLRVIFDYGRQLIYIYIYIYIYDGNSINEKLAIGSLVCSCTFFKKINSRKSFFVPEDCQHYLLYWALCSGFFLQESQCVSTLWTVSTQEEKRNTIFLTSIFSGFILIFRKKYLWSTYSHEFSVLFVVKDNDIFEKERKSWTREWRKNVKIEIGNPSQE